jgi:hypothetical protein
VNNPQLWQAIAAVTAALAALLGGLYAIVTSPIENHLRGIEARLTGMQNGLQSQLTGMENSMQAQLNDIRFGAH